MFVYLERVLDLCQLIWGVGTLVVVGSTQGHPRGGVEILTPSPWLDCPTLAGCRPPISVGHQGNRATLGSEPGDIQPRLGRVWGRVFEGSVCRVQERLLSPSPQFRLHSSPHRSRKALMGACNPFLYILFGSQPPC